MANKTFGGYFPLELPPAGAHYYPHARTYRSARSALYHFLTCVRPQRLWLPRLICQSVIDAVVAAKVEIVWYRLTDDYLPLLSLPFEKADCLLYVDYLGQGGEQKEKLSRMIPAQRIIFDHSQAFYQQHYPALANLYSPRKFFGVADGGFLQTQIDLPFPETQDRESLHHSAHLLVQHEHGTSAGYADFQQAESALNSITAMKMSALTERILRSVDYERIKAVRERNYTLLSESLGSLNAFRFSKVPVPGPFCYPFFYPARPLHQPLIARGVFVATYWREVLERVEPDSVEANFVNYMIPLPCDQRYSEDDIQQLSEIVRSVVTDEAEE
ncbi:hypothetical protein [Phytobacter sp. RSE-02]|uniref:hypothetical protein n=1 Tax=Phytobacter sp. RSE-02 TaxID=3229229 RepID=UPI00339D451A